MDVNNSENTCVKTILDIFQRKPMPNRLDCDKMTPSVATRLNFDEDLSVSSESGGARKLRRLSGGESTIFNAKTQESSVINSPWETRRLKGELIDSKSQITKLEMRVNQLHALRRELEVVFEAEKNSFLQQQERDRMMIQTLETRVAQLRRRETDAREECVFKVKDLEEEQCRLESLLKSLRKQKSQISEELYEVKSALKAAENRASLYESELNTLKNGLHSDTKESASDTGGGVEGLESQPESVQSSQIVQNEKLLLDLKEAQRKLKGLEHDLEINKEASEMVRSQQHKLLKMPDLEREIETLRNDNKKLRDAVHNKLLLEEEVADLRQKCAMTGEWERRIIQLEAQEQMLQNALSDWKGLVLDFCTDVSEKNTCPSVLRRRIQELQQSELLLTAEVADLEGKLRAFDDEKMKSEAQVKRMTDEINRIKLTNEQHANLIRRWQKKLMLITGERNSYREQLDSYEKELTVSAASNQQQSTQCRLEALEKSVEGYKELVESLESELASALGKGGSRGLAEKLRVITAERDSLQNDNTRLQKQCDELQELMEGKALKGEMLKSSKILHFKLNPVAVAEDERNEEIALLRSEVAKLRERVRVLQEGEQDEITSKVNHRLVSSSSQEVQELREQIKSSDLMIQRLKEAFKKTSSEFRDCVYQLLGFKVDRLQNKGMFRLLSMYAESPTDYLLFKMESNGTLTLLETTFSASVEDLIELHLRQQRSLPVFLAAVTMDLFSRQSMLITSGSVADEPIVLD